MGEEANAPSSSTSSSTTTEKEQLKEAILEIASLISVSHSIRVFTAKWQSARSKLEELISTLAAIENCELGGGNPSLSAAVEEILATLRNGSELARRCSESSYSGKLLMQSDLDVLSATLDAHIGSLRGIYAAGLLEQSHALVVSRPAASASRDDVRFYLNDVVSRLKIGSKTMKKEALLAFNEVIREEERYIKICIEIDGLVNLLVNFLDFDEEELQEEAARAVCLIAGLPACKTALIAAGAIAPLIRVVECGSELSKEFAARCLMKMTENSDNAWAVSAHGGVPALLKICCDGGGGELVCLACGVLKNLVAVEEIKRFMVEDGAIAGLVGLAGSRDEGAQMGALDLLQTMAYRDESIREAIITSGGIATLVSILDPASPVSTKTREVAFRGMTSICLSSESSIGAMMSHGFCDHILHFLRFGEVTVQELALKAAFWLCGASEHAKKVMGDAGFMPLLLKFLDSKSFEIREIAAETLSSMLLVPKNRKRFVQNDQNVVVLMQMLDPEHASSGNKKLLLSILMSLTSSNSARKKMLSSGYLKNIEKLAEDESSDAKKIVRKLSSSRIRSVLNVFWHS